MVTQRRSQRRRQTSLIRAILDGRRAKESGEALLEAFPDQAALLDGAGAIIRTNQAWKAFALENGGELARLDAGAAYLEACRSVEDDPEVAELGELLHEVISGARARLSYEYPCHSATERRWFLMRAGHLPPGGALVIHTNITQRKLAELHAEQLANHDPLTRALNRRGFTRRLQEEVARTRRHRSPLSAILIDCDDFKHVNSRFGHAVGDVVLIEIARRLCESLRPEDVMARIGGDEFVVLLPHSNVAEARLVADRLRLAITTKSFVTNDSIALTMSCSAAVAGLDEMTNGIDDILRACAAGLTAVKATGKNRTSAPLEADDAEVARLLNVQLRIVRQPIVDLGTATRVGYEFLTRGTDGLESPVDLFRKAIELDMLQRVDLLCLHAALARARCLPPDVPVHINLYPSTLLSLDIDGFAELIGDPELCRRICIELCEQEIVGDPIYLRDKATALRSFGLSLAIDDVGFGRTSLENLILLEPEVIKIDRRLIFDVALDPGKARQLARVVRMSAALQAQVVVEGVESAADATVCRDLGVAMGQGYLWGRPEAF
jgi:diguanylate cyclase (GGDEF)-like protein